MVSFWLAGKKLPTPLRAHCVNALARAKALPEPFVIVDLAPKARRPGDRVHRARTFANPDLGAIVRACGDVFLFADAASVSVQTVYRWASGRVWPRPQQAGRVNALARAKGLREPFGATDVTQFVTLKALVRACGGPHALAAKVPTHFTSVHRWARGVEPREDTIARLNALAREHGFAGVFVGRPTITLMGRLCELGTAYGAEAIAATAGVSMKVVRAWDRGTKKPSLRKATIVNEMARARRLREPFPRGDYSIGPFAELVRVYGGVAAFAAAIPAGRESLYRWSREETQPRKWFVARMNGMAREHGVPEPFLDERPRRKRQAAKQ